MFRNTYEWVYIVALSPTDQTITTAKLHFPPYPLFTMQITIVSVLTAALATLSAAAAVPAAPAVSKPLPAKFTLTMTPNVANTGTVVDKFPSVVTIDEGADTSMLAPSLPS